MTTLTNGSTSLTLVPRSGNAKTSKIPDLKRARQYLAEIESVARSAKQTSDPRVLVTALRLLACQGRNVAELGVLA